MPPLSSSNFCSRFTLGTIFTVSAITVLFWQCFRNYPANQDTSAENREVMIRARKINASNITVKENVTAIAEGYGATANVSGARAPKGSIQAIAIDSHVSQERRAQLDALFRRRR